MSYNHAGPEIRSGLLENHKDVFLAKGSKFELHCQDDSMLGNATKVSVMYPNLTKVVKPGDHVLIDDGLIDLHVDSVDDAAHIVYTTVVNSGMLGERKGVNLPGVAVDLPAVTQKDVGDLKFGVDQGVDFVAASFIRKASDVHTIRKVLGAAGRNIQIISKIESQEGLDNFDEILSASDGIMVARGDLGVEIPIEQVAIAQKMMIHKCNAAGKYVITATQMLESMIKNPSPTRAEATDVANAVLDGTDCVMLSGETAKGAYPVQAVQTMADICREAEANINHQATFNMIREHIKGNIVSVVEAIASSAVRATFDLNATMIICLTETGHTARLVAKYRPRAPIVTVTSNEQTARQGLVSRGLFPLLVGSMVGSDSLINRVLIAAQRLGMCKVGDMVVVTSGSREATSGTTNDLKIIQVGSVSY
jgi:pyruvate kinase